MSTRTITMVTSLGPWDPEWSHAHGYNKGYPTRSYSRYGCTEHPDLIRQEIRFLEKNFPNSQRIFYLKGILNVLRDFDISDKKVQDILKYKEWQVWWWEEQEFKKENGLLGAGKKEPSFDELKERYGDYLAKSIKYIPTKMYLEWIESHVLPRIQFVNH